MPNHLANSLSPYLLQHAGNPVDWYPWGDEAIEIARREDKPIFLSIGYAACHWCHVMAHESFEDAGIAALLNQHFVSIKVDREERPDLDGIFMAAVVALTGQGGWPMSVFLTPDLQPFYGGTYFPPARRSGMTGFKDLLVALAEAWQGQRAEVGRVSREIVENLNRLETAHGGTALPQPDVLERAARGLEESYNWEDGGWGSAPKFPQPMAIEFLLRRVHSGDGAALQPAVHALRAMTRGGMYDVVGGGFSRYSTDAAWRVPHFEKMLYDNAQLLQASLHAWQLSGDGALRRVVEETLAFVSRELTAPQGGFYSSLDADSDDEEGRFYVWEADELRSLLGEDFDFFSTAYGVTSAGNWEGKMVLQRAVDDASLATRFGLTPGLLAGKLADCHSRLLAARAGRVRPKTDDKILTDWNGLMLATVAECGRVFGSSDLLSVATRTAHFLLSALRPDGRLRHAWRDGQAGQEVFLGDYAALILGLLELYQADFDPGWFAQACTLADEMVAEFADPCGGFFDTRAVPIPGLERPKDLQDNATPSGNALAAEALLKLAALTENEAWRNGAEQTLQQLPEVAVKYPLAFGRWLCSLDLAHAPIKQVAILGAPGEKSVGDFLKVLRSAYRPDLVLAMADLPVPAGAPALLQGRTRIGGLPTAYVCTGFACQQPVTGADEFARQLNGE